MINSTNHNITFQEDSQLKFTDLESSYLKPNFNIGFDGKRAAKNLTGLGNYSRWLVSQLATHFPDINYYVYASSLKNSPRISSFFTIPKVFLKLPRVKGLFWRSKGIIKDLETDNVKIFHGLSHELPFGIQSTSIIPIVTIHDLIFLKQPKHYNFIDRFIYTAKSKFACRYAHKIIAISEQTKKDIIRYFNITESKIEVIYQSCDDSFKQLFSELQLKEISFKYQLPEKYILYVGTIESRKNLKTLITALPSVHGDYKLVVIGRKTSYFNEVNKEIQRLNLANRVCFFENMNFSDLPAVYQLAELFVLPSFYEGFGIPIIEAMYSKTPVIAATGSCLEEAGGPNSLYINPYDSLDLSLKINTVINDKDLQLEMIEKGYTYVQKFDNAILTQQLMNCYLKALSHG